MLGRQVEAESEPLSQVRSGKERGKECMVTGPFAKHELSLCNIFY